MADDRGNPEQNSGSAPSRNLTESDQAYDIYCRRLSTEGDKFRAHLDEYATVNTPYRADFVRQEFLKKNKEIKGIYSNLDKKIVVVKPSLSPTAGSNPRNNPTVTEHSVNRGQVEGLSIGKQVQTGSLQIRGSKLEETLTRTSAQVNLPRTTGPAVNMVQGQLTGSLLQRNVARPVVQGSTIAPLLQAQLAEGIPMGKMVQYNNHVIGYSTVSGASYADHRVVQKSLGSPEFRQLPMERLSGGRPQVPASMVPGCPNVPTNMVTGSRPNVPANMVSSSRPNVPTNMVPGSRPNVPTNMVSNSRSHVPTNMGSGSRPHVPTNMVSSIRPNVPTNMVPTVQRQMYRPYYQTVDTPQVVFSSRPPGHTMTSTVTSQKNAEIDSVHPPKDCGCSKYSQQTNVDQSISPQRMSSYAGHCLPPERNIRGQQSPTSSCASPLESGEDLSFSKQHRQYPMKKTQFFGQRQSHTVTSENDTAGVLDLSMKSPKSNSPRSSTDSPSRQRESPQSTSHVQTQGHTYIPVAQESVQVVDLSSDSNTQCCREFSYGFRQHTPLQSNSGENSPEVRRTSQPQFDPKHASSVRQTMMIDTEQNRKRSNTTMSSLSGGSPRESPTKKKRTHSAMLTSMFSLDGPISYQPFDPKKKKVPTATLR